MRLLFSMPSYALLAVMALLTIFSIRSEKPKPDQLCLASSALFFGYILARGFLSPVDYIARADIYSVLGGLLVYLFVACVLTGAKPRIFVLLGLLAIGMVHVVIGAIQFTQGQNFMLIPFLGRFDYGRRASGFYISPNHLAGLLEVLGIFGLSIVCWSRLAMWLKLLAGYATGVCYLGLILTGSRGGYLSTMASLLVFALLSLTGLSRASAKLFWRIGLPFVILSIAICVAVPWFIRQSVDLNARAANLLGEDLSDPSAALRTEYWQAALKQWELDPVWGTGSGTYLYYGRLFRGPHVDGDPTHVHNDYYQLLGEYGLAGAAGFLLFLFFHLWRGGKTFRRLGPKRVAASAAPSFLSNGLALNIGALGTVAAYGVHSVVDFNLHVPANVLVVAFAFGLLANGGSRRAGETHRLTVSLVLWRLALPGIGLLVAIQCARLLPGEYFAEGARTALRKSGQSAAAMNLALNGLETEKGNPYLYQYLATAQIQQADSTSDKDERVSRYRAAITALGKAHVLAPKDKTFTFALALAYEQLGQFDEAESMYKQTIALDPNLPWIKENYEAFLQRVRDRTQKPPPGRDVSVKPEA